MRRRRRARQHRQGRRHLLPHRPRPRRPTRPSQTRRRRYDALPEGVRVLVDKPFTGDFDEMVKRRAIRVAVTFNRTHYFVDQGQERGITYEALKSFENDLNTDLKTGNLKVHVVMVPMSRDMLLSRARGRQGRHGRRHGDGQTRTGEARRLLGADPHQRERGGGHRTGSAADRHGRRSRRPGGVRPKGERLSRDAHPSERAAESARQAAPWSSTRPPTCSKTTTCSRWSTPGSRRSPIVDDYLADVLEPGVHRHQSAQRRRACAPAATWPSPFARRIRAPGESSTSGSGSTARATRSATCSNAAISRTSST